MAKMHRGDDPNRTREKSTHSARADSVCLEVLNQQASRREFALQQTGTQTIQGKAQQRLDLSGF
jgi:hypothetical protein